MHSNNDRQYFSLRTQSIGRLLLSMVVLALTSACANKVTVISEVPTPLVERVPLNVHLKFTDEFKNHVYVENEKKRSLSSLNMAEAQTDMFTSIFSGLTNLVEPDNENLDLIIEPQVLDFQYTAPAETKLKQYEIWLKYRLRILKQDQSEFADWTVKGYGKTPTALLSNASKAFNSATNIALRDIGAQLATQFPRQQKIKALIDAKQGSMVDVATTIDSPDSVEARDEQ